MSDKKGTAQLIAAFNASEHKWRTVKGLVKDSGLPINEVAYILHNSDSFIRAKKSNTSGEALYALSSNVTELALAASGHKGFVVSPFDTAGQRVKSAAERTLKELGVQIVELDSETRGTMMMNNVTEAIRTSDFIVVDISRQNLSVFYELGYAHALRKHTILIREEKSGGGLPFDLSGFLYIVYNEDDLSDLAEQIKRSAIAFINRKEK